MSFLERLKTAFSGSTPEPSEAWRSVIRPVGTAEPHCPYCGHAFEKMPGRKRDCPSCRGTFYSRKRPSDGLKVLLTEADAAEVEGQSALLTLVQENDPSASSAETIFRQLSASLGRAPNAEDLVAAYLMALATSHEQAWKWGLFRNARFGLAESCARRRAFDDAVNLYLEVCLLDLNGPRNLGSRDPGLVKRFPPFDPSHSFLAPGVLSRLEDAAKERNLLVDELKGRFVKLAKTTGRRFGLPRDVDDAWRELARALSPST